MKRIKRTTCLATLYLLCVSTMFTESVAFAATSPDYSADGYREVYTKLADS